MPAPRGAPLLGYIIVIVAAHLTSTALLMVPDTSNIWKGNSGIALSLIFQLCQYVLQSNTWFLV